MLLELIIRATLFYAIPIGIGSLVVAAVQFLWRRSGQPFLQRSAKVDDLFTGKAHTRSLNAADEAFIRAIITGAGWFATGMVSILLWAQLSHGIAQVTELPLFVPLFFGGSYLLFFAAAVRWIVIALSSATKRFSIGLTQFAYLALVIASGFMASWLWMRTTATPLNWDLYEHQTLATLIQSGQFNLITSQLSDTFGFLSYPPTFHALVALSQFGLELTPATILRYWDALAVAHAMSVAIATFTLGLVVTRRRSVALIASIFSVFVFESVMAFTALFPLPQNLTATLWTLVLASVLWLRWRRRPLLWPLLFGCLALISSHFIVGSAGALLLIGTLSFAWLYERSPHRKWHLALWVVLLSTLLISTILSYAIHFSGINRGEAAAFTFSFSEKMKYLRNMYVLLPLFIIPVIWSSFHSASRLAATTKYFLAAGCVLPFVVLSGIPYAFKFLTLFHFVFVILVATGLAWCLQKLPSWINVVTAYVLGVLLLTVTAGRWQADLAYDNRASHVSTDELAAAEYLQRRPDAASTLIISDPATQYILEGLSGVNSPGGAFTGSPLRFTLAKQYEQTKFSTDELSSIADAITAPPTTRLLVISGRTFQWWQQPVARQQALDFNIWRPYRLSLYDQALLTMMLMEQPYPIEYRNDSLVIVQLPNQ